MVTTIQIEEKIKHRLDALKVYTRETYNQVIERLIENNLDKGRLSESTMKNIELSLEDIRKGRVYTTEEVRKRLGIGK